MKSAPLTGRPDWAKPKPVTGDAPLPLSREIDPPTPFPVDALGPIGADVVKAMQTVIQAPVALLGQTILAAMNQVAQPHANVVVDGRVSPLSEFFLTLGESGERKSAGDSWALMPVRARQRLLMQQYASEREQYEMAAQLFEAQAKRIAALRSVAGHGPDIAKGKLPRLHPTGFRKARHTRRRPPPARFGQKLGQPGKRGRNGAEGVEIETARRQARGFALECDACRLHIALRIQVLLNPPQRRRIDQDPRAGGTGCRGKRTQVLAVIGRALQPGPVPAG